MRNIFHLTTIRTWCWYPAPDSAISYLSPCLPTSPLPPILATIHSLCRRLSAPLKMWQTATHQLKSWYAMPPPMTRLVQPPMRWRKSPLQLIVRKQTSWKSWI